MFFSLDRFFFVREGWSPPGCWFLLENRWILPEIKAKSALHRQHREPSPVFPVPCVPPNKKKTFSYSHFSDFLFADCVAELIIYGIIRITAIMVLRINGDDAFGCYDQAVAGMDSRGGRIGVFDFQEPIAFQYVIGIRPG